MYPSMRFGKSAIPKQLADISWKKFARRENPTSTAVTVLSRNVSKPLFLSDLRILFLGRMVARQL